MDTQTAGVEYKSKIPGLIEEKGFTIKQFVAYCMLAGISQTTAYKMATGATDVSIPSLAAAAVVLKTTIGNLLEIE
jgi:hypothetical protein